MSEKNEVDTSCCASCGVAEVDDIKLMSCNDSYLVRYCSDECQRDHKSQHEDACKKRAAELRDELLFNQLEGTHLGDCPICFLPLPLDKKKSFMMACCSKLICIGCNSANGKREAEMRLKRTCPFCREAVPKTNEEVHKRRMKRVEASDPVALREEGVYQYKNGDYRKAFECYKQTAELGDAEGHYRLARLYHYGRGVEKDRGEWLYHIEEAAIRGHPEARCFLGAIEWDCGNAKRAVRHWVIAATQGEDQSIKLLMEKYKDGFVAKEDLAATLRANQAAVDATKSPQRDVAEEYYRNISNM